MVFAAGEVDDWHVRWQKIVKLTDAKKVAGEFLNVLRRARAGGQWPRPDFAGRLKLLLAFRDAGGGGQLAPADLEDAAAS